MQTIKVICTASLLMLFLNTPVQAGMHCGNNRIVATGATKSEVIQRCGKPSYRTYNVWTYVPKSKRKFIKHLIFKNGKLKKVKMGGKRR